MGVFDDDYEREDRAELLARIATLEAAIQRALDEAVADDQDEWFAALRAVLTPAPAPKGKSWIADLLAAHPAPEGDDD